MGSSPGTLYGTPIVYDTVTVIKTPFGDFREVIAPGALTRALDDPNITAVVGHDPTKLIGRVVAGSLGLIERAHGVDAKITLPDTELAHETATLVERGDLHGMSFSVPASAIVDEWFDPVKPGGMPTSVITEITRLLDVSPVTWPAYTTTSIRLQRSQELDPADRMRELKHRTLEHELAAAGQSLNLRARHRRALAGSAGDRARDAQFNRIRRELDWKLGRKCRSVPKQAQHRRFGLQRVEWSVGA